VGAVSLKGNSMKQLINWFFNAVANSGCDKDKGE